MKFIKINFCSVKETVKGNEKISHKLGENICKRLSDKGLLPNIYKELLKLSKITNNLIKKQAKDLTRPHKGRCTDGKGAYEKMLHIICHLGIAN